MCGRFQLDFSLEDLERYYKLIDELGERKNEAKHNRINNSSDESNNAKIVQEDILAIQGVRFPDNSSLIVTNESLKLLNWGFPFNNKLIINARGESIFEKRMFSKAILSRRCLVPANLFFEWKDKVKYEIKLREEKVFSMAGIYSIFHTKDGNFQERYLIITTEANEDMKSIHHRMPVIVPPSLEKDYLNPHSSPEEIISMLKPYKKGSLLIKSMNNHEQLSLF